MMNSQSQVFVRNNSEKKQRIDICNKLKDPYFKNGFDVYMVEDGIANLPLSVKREIRFDNINTSLAEWQIAQWNNYNNKIEEAQYSQNNGFHSFKAKGGTHFMVDPNRGVVKMILNTKSEYGKNSVSPDNPRKDGQKWPHLLISQTMDEKSLSISDMVDYDMKLTYQIDSITNNHVNNSFDKRFHSAQFQWFISLNNQNKNSEGYGDYFWFGFSFYDFRYEFSPFYANVDTNTTGKFIYMPDMKEILGVGNATTIGKIKTVCIPIKSHLKKAFQLAKDNGFLKTTNWEDLFIGHTNIGWEVPGSFDVAATIQEIGILSY